jgi:hypothetical protein
MVIGTPIQPVLAAQVEIIATFHSGNVDTDPRTPASQPSIRRHSMPIRFRCVFCQQLLGIGRRKAGTVVRCPTCANQVVVPGPNSSSPDRTVEDGGKILERSDFDEIFAPSTQQSDAKKARRKKARQRKRLAAPSTAAKGNSENEKAVPAYSMIDAENSPQDSASATLPAANSPDRPVVEISKPKPPRIKKRAPANNGIFLSPGMVTWLSVAVVVGLILALAAGAAIGLYLAKQFPNLLQTGALPAH